MGFVEQPGGAASLRLESTYIVYSGVGGSSGGRSA